ncbi:hypothetical protein [Klebsiella quasipneumoniae]|uniref:Uncharacterized protein n=1 Tax=Klebsiella quasipneumoniae subsp. quasipneumoniae TaxID=1667327 RepID=A0AAW8XWT7_9ENTR|nr:hypothetical protein [Klebsiella quasipneumoniae]MDV0844966.1 hypothetical protein [Klebsiella quasipneumoniae subsp. quasipneumoniae]
MTEPEIIEHLREGWTLTNRGTGWYLTAPKVPYRKSKQYQIPERVVSAMEKDGIIKTVMPYLTIRAELLEQQNPSIPANEV